MALTDLATMSKLLQQQAMQDLMKTQQFKQQGLLGDMTPRQYGLLGAAQALQPYMGYTDRPISAGQVLAAAGSGYMGGMQQGRQQILSDALSKLTLAEKITPKDGDYDRAAGIKQYAKEQFGMDITDEQAKLIDSTVGKDVRYVTNEGIVVNKLDIALEQLYENRPISETEAVVNGETIKESSKEEQPKFKTGEEELTELRLDKEVKALGEDYIKADIPNLISTYEEAGKFINMDNIPGYGQTGMLPDYMLSYEGKSARSALGRLFNITLKDRSGAAVTEPELERLKQEFSTGKFKTDEDIRSAYNRALKILKDHTQSILASYPKEVQEKYFEQGAKGFGQINLYNKYNL